MKLEPNAEQNSSRIHSKLQTSATGAISAYRGEYNHKENRQRNRSLLAKLSCPGYKTTSINGSYIENYSADTAIKDDEHSFFVTSNFVGNDEGRLEQLLVNLGKEFDLDSILSIPFGGEARLIGTTEREDADPKLGEVKLQGSFKDGKAGEYMNMVHNKTFIFEDIEPPCNWLGYWGASSFAKTPWRDIVLND